MNFGQCVQTSACDQMTCDQVRRFMPSSISGMVRRCRAKCCKGGECHNLPNSRGGVPLLPGTSNESSQRQAEYPSIGNSAGVTNLPSMFGPTDDNNEGNNHNVLVYFTLICTA